MGFAAVFSYEVDRACADAFEDLYGPDGEWARFFGRGDGYAGTELWCARGESPRRYLVIDHWRSRAAYEDYLRASEAEYRRRSDSAERLYLRETPLGRFDAC